MASGKSISTKMDDLRIALREPLERPTKPRNRTLRGKTRIKARKAAQRAVADGERISGYVNVPLDH